MPYAIDLSERPTVTRSVTGMMFDESGQLRREVVRRIRREQRRQWLRSWRPRLNVRIRFMVFPKTQRRLEALEKECESLRRESALLRSAIQWNRVQMTKLSEMTQLSEKT